MGRLRIAITTVLVAGAMVPALTPGRFFGGGSKAPIAAIDAFRSLPDAHADVAKIDTVDIGYSSLRAFTTLADGKPDKSDRSKASGDAFKADPTMKAAKEELRRVADVNGQRAVINGARNRVLASLLLLIVAIAVVAGLRRFRHGSLRSATLLLVAGFAVAPLAIPHRNSSSVSLAGLMLFAERPGPGNPADLEWREVKPAPAGEVWSAAAIDALRPSAHPDLAASVLRDGAFIPPDYSDQSRWRLLVPSLSAAMVAGLASLVLRRLPKLDTWTPAFRRYIPTLWPTRTLVVVRPES
jgi:hypothetical protein